MTTPKPPFRYTKYFANSPIRSFWHYSESQWYFSIIDVMRVLSGSMNHVPYLTKILNKDKELSEKWEQITKVFVVKTDEETQKVNCANGKNLLRITESLTGTKLERFREWVELVGETSPQK